MGLPPSVRRWVAQNVVSQDTSYTLVIYHPSVRTNDLRRGAVLMIASALLFAVMGAGVKVAARTLPNAHVVFFRCALGLLALLPWLAPLGLAGLRTARWREHLVRGLAGLAAMYCFFYALGHMRLPDAVLLNYSIPLFMPFVEALWLGEPIPRRIWGPVGVGFAGIVLILKPGLELFQPVALVGVLAAAFASVAQVGIRQLTRTEPVARIIFYFGLVSTVVSGLPVAGSWRTPQGSEWWLLIAIGVLATLGQLFLTSAYGHAPAARVGPFIYSSVVFAGLLEWALWDSIPDALAITGMALVAAAGVLALRIGADPPQPAPAA
jgi:drug/metabolite transporter (DMT)-like permease